MKKLFPKKQKDKVETQAKLKTTIHQLNIKTKEFNRKSKEAKLKAMQSLKSGNKDLARQMLIRSKAYSLKTQKYYNMIGKLERHLEALEEAKTIEDVSGALEKSSGELGKIAQNVNPAKAMELVDGAEDAIGQIEEAGDLMAGDMETDLGLDVEDELSKLETEMLMADASGMPSIPETADDIDIGITEEPDENEIRSKQKIEEEIKKLKKELEE